MKRTISTLIPFSVLIAVTAYAQVVLPPIRRTYEPGNTKPILVSMSGLTGETLMYMVGCWQ